VFEGPNTALTYPRPVAGEPAPGGPATLWPVITVVVISVLAYIGLSVLVAPPSVVDAQGTALPYNFKSERGSITLLSSAMFLMAGGLAGGTLLLVWADRGRSRLLWLAFTAVMVYFSVDEVLGFHEEMGQFLDEHVSPGPFRTWNDVVVIIYGVVALPLALLLWREVLRYARLLPMLVITGVLYVATSSVDTLTESASATSTVIEEGIKVTCSTFFMLSMLTGLVAARWMHASRVNDVEHAAAPGQ
jgi:hypothetical protein